LKRLEDARNVPEEMQEPIEPNIPQETEEPIEPIIPEEFDDSQLPEGFNESQPKPEDPAPESTEIPPSFDESSNTAQPTQAQEPESIESRFTLETEAKITEYIRQVTTGEPECDPLRLELISSVTSKKLLDFYSAVPDQNQDQNQYQDRETEAEAVSDSFEITDEHLRSSFSAADLSPPPPPEDDTQRTLGEFKDRLIDTHADSHPSSQLQINLATMDYLAESQMTSSLHPSPKNL